MDAEEVLLTPLRHPPEGWAHGVECGADPGTALRPWAFTSLWLSAITGDGPSPRRALRLLLPPQHPLVDAKTANASAAAPHRDRRFNGHLLSSGTDQVLSRGTRPARDSTSLSNPRRPVETSSQIHSLRGSRCSGDSLPKVRGDLRTGGTSGRSNGARAAHEPAHPRPGGSAEDAPARRGRARRSRPARRRRPPGRGLALLLS